MAANDAVSMNVAENRQNVPMAIQENRAAVPMTVAEGGGTPGGLNRKADKVTGAVAGNLAGLDANGNLTDSGKAPGDFLEAPATAGSEGQVLTADGEGGASWQDPTGGDPTEIIDDNAGSGDTDKVWSADKSHELLTEINSATTDIQRTKEEVFGDDPVDILESLSTYTDGSRNGIEYTINNSTKVVTASGTRTGSSFRAIYSSQNSLPQSIVPGDSYNLNFVSESQYLIIYVIFYKNGTELSYLPLFESTKITIPEAATGFAIRFQVLSGWPENSSSTITFPKMMTIPENKGLAGNATETASIEEESFARSRMINNQLTELQELRNYVDSSVSALMEVQSNEGTTKTISLTGLPEADKIYVRLGLHYGASAYTPNEDDVFFDGDCKTDFSDVRFFDSNGNIIRAMFGPAVNMDILRDTKLKYVDQVSANGLLVAFNVEDDDGIYISTDNGTNFSLISGTANVTNKASAVYGLKSMRPVYVDDDDNIFAYAGGKLYKLLSSDSYATKTEVLDYSWVNNGTTIYPDIQVSAIDKSTNGTLFVGACYQTQYHVSVYKSTDGGNTWSLAWHNWDGSVYQHVHHIHADPNSSRVYVGIDDNASTWSGSRIIYTDDEGSTWTEIDPTQRKVVGKDYYPTYFGDGTYKLGGGETYLMGSASIYRSKDDLNMDMPMLGLSGVRSFQDFGDDSVILCGTSTNMMATENCIMMSTDKGKSWKAIFTKYQNHLASSGTGFRQIHPYIQIMDDTEPCMVLSDGVRGGLSAIRIYKGGSHYFREVYLELENTNGNATITAKSGYMMPYPFKVIEEQETRNLLYRIPLNEGCGKYVQDSRNVIAEIKGERKWDNKESVRFGDYKGVSTKFSLVPTSGVKVGEGSKLTFPANTDLDFTKNYTVSVWLNPKAFGLEIQNDADYNDKMFAFRHIVTIGAVSFATRGHSQYCILPSSADPTISNYNAKNFPFNGKQFAEKTGVPNCDQYFNVVFTVDNDGAVSVYVNGCPATTDWKNDASNALGNLSSGSIRFGTSYAQGNAGCVSDLRVYNKSMSSTEVLMMYRGWKFKEAE